MANSLPEDSTSPDRLSLWQLRTRLINMTIALADELAVDGEAHRLEALSELYRMTWETLRQRDARAAR